MSGTLEEAGIVAMARYTFGGDSRPEQLKLLGEVLDSDQLGMFFGRMVRSFEERAAAFIGCAETVAHATGTAALEVILKALGVGPGDEVVVPEFSWISVGGAVWAAGAEVRVAPVREHLTPDWDDIRAALRPRTRAVVLAHVRGAPAPRVAEIADGLRTAGIPMIEDCAQAWGVRLDGRHVGTFGTLSFFSTQAYKLISTGEGGLVAGDDPELLRRVRLIQGDTRVVPDRPQWRVNTRMSELQAAVAIPQLERLPDLVSRLTALQERIGPALASLPRSRAIVPDARLFGGHQACCNGTFAGAWFRDAASAGRAHDGLVRLGVRSRRGVAANDLHFAHRWPVARGPSHVDHEAYLEAAVPDLAPEHHEAFARLVARAVP